MNKNAAVQETRSKAFSLTRLAPERYAAGMRTYLLALAVVVLFGVAPSRAEYDAAGIGPAKPKATQSAFDGIAGSRPAPKLDALTDIFMHSGNLVIWPAQFPVRLLPSPGTRVKVIHRPANVPSQSYTVIPITYYWDGAMTK